MNNHGADSDAAYTAAQVKGAARGTLLANSLNSTIFFHEAGRLSKGN
jgi:hypothetical protein